MHVYIYTHVCVILVMPCYWGFHKLYVWPLFWGRGQSWVNQSTIKVHGFATALCGSTGIYNI